MKYLVIVRAESDDQYTAQPVGFPELRAVAAMEAEAVDRASQALARWLASAKLVPVDVPIPGDGNPWLATIGRSANDPDFDEFLEEMKQARLADAVE